MQELQTQLWTLMRRGRQQIAALEGVSRTAARVLITIARREDGTGVTPGHLAERLSMATSNVAAALRELDQAGYVYRQRSTQDGRRVTVMLTQAGRNVIHARHALRADALRDVIQRNLSDEEQAQLAAVIPLLARINAATADPDKN